MKVLLACDFDHTIINDNSDTWVLQLSSDKVPADIRSRYDIHGSWTDYMDEIFKFLHSKGITPEQIINHMQKIPFVDGMKELLLLQAQSQSVDCIILSDSNKIFINCILEASGLLESIGAVYTNPAEFQENGCLSVSHYHKHGCQLCPVNLCKTEVLQNYLKTCRENGKVYDVVVFVGDGGNDFCPCLNLSERDAVFARKGYRLVRKIEKLTSNKKSNLKPEVKIWESGFEIKSHLESLLK
ncbi:pyridoxal phosphate phosphatase PHOSPHO2-like [Anneissia japonica]|uniref:pyridoxal phosphate phosphatase PHOSPHO2-like n=1 Tax=Anneissia japonica TaxID=1529436 RepID=UPI00142578E2|nr:pyridoxal phosphate phosphatase PHOSPHO2-like [Anneissia japonica]